MSFKPSYNKLIDAKIVQRTDQGMTILFDHIFIRPGFNLRDTKAPDYDSEIEALVEHSQRGGKIPPLEVVLSYGQEGMVEVIDGHRRYEMYRRLRERGVPVQKVSIVNFEGNDLAQFKRIFSSQEGAKLKPVEIGMGYQILKEQFKLTPDEIARQMGKTRQHVDQMLILANAPDAVQRMVTQGEVSATEAVKVARASGDKATEILKDAKAAAGGAKVTAKALKPWSPPAKLAAPLTGHVNKLLGTIKPEILAKAGKVGTFLDAPDEIVSVDISMRDLWMLVQNMEVIGEAKEAHEEKLRAKVEKAAQKNLPDADTGGA